MSATVASAAIRSGRAAAKIAENHHVLYTPRHQEFRAALGQFIDRTINPHVDAWERAERFPAHELFSQLGTLGVFGINKPTEYGGLGLDFSYSVAVAEEMGRTRCGAIPMAVAVQSDMATPALAAYGSDSLRRSFLEPTLRGHLVACIGVSEPHAGSDVAAITTSARRSGDDLIIDGCKTWITNGYQADWVCLLANTVPGAPDHRNKSLICVPLDAKGVHRPPPIRKLGMMSSDTAQIHFDGVRVPRTNVIGDEGRGFLYQMEQFQNERLVTAAVLLEPMERLIRQVIDYTRERKAFGKPLIDNQVIHYKLAELSTEIEATRSLLYRAVLERETGTNVTRLASMAKLKAARLARTTTDTCLQFFGGVGYTWEHESSRFFRDLRLHSIAAGCDEVMLSIVCRYMETLPKD